MLVDGLKCVNVYCIALERTTPPTTTHHTKNAFKRILRVNTRTLAMRRRLSAHGPSNSRGTAARLREGPRERQRERASEKARGGCERGALGSVEPSGGRNRSRHAALEHSLH